MNVQYINGRTKNSMPISFLLFDCLPSWDDGNKENKCLWSRDSIANIHNDWQSNYH